jgi:hypothetical protein
MPSEEQAHDATPPAAPKPRPDQEDQLSPARALRQTSASGGGQRVGDSGPLANPEVSFPDD